MSRVRDPARIDLDTVRDALASHRPGRVVDATRRRGWQAATALVLAPGTRHGGLEVALIERVERAGDRWSGHMALPGGRRDPADPDLAVTAAREAYEEVGLRLPAPDGRLADQGGRLHGGVVANYVFTLDESQELVPDPAEVAAAWWVPLARLFDPAAGTRVRAAGLRFSGVDHDGRVIWGMTLAVLRSFAAAVGLAAPQA